MSEEKSDSTQQQKDIAYYSALVDAWIQTKMSQDKIFISLSAGGIGLLITILTTVGVQDLWQITLYVGAFVAFAVCVGTSMYILGRNAKHIEEVLNKNASCDYVLRRCDQISLVAFIVGAVLFTAIAFTTAVCKLEGKGGEKVTEKKEVEDTTHWVPLSESINGIRNLKSSDESTKNSLNESTKNSPNQQTSTDK